MKELANLAISEVDVVGGIAGIIVILSIFVEITPIKINPVSHLLAWIGNKTNKELLDRFDEVDKKVNSLEDRVENIQSDADERDAIECRIRILQFGDEVRCGAKHSEESFEQVLSDIDRYEAYCDKHPDFMNNRTALTKQKILDVYSKCLAQNDFL